MALFLDLSALQKFIRRGYGKHAAVVAKNIPDSHRQSRLYTILFEDIGLANVPLLQQLLKPAVDISKQVVKMAISTKSRLCSYLSYDFREIFVNLEQHEPFPEKQACFANLDDSNIMTALHVAAALYWKGMDTIFWDLIQGDLHDDDREFADNLRSVMDKINERAHPMVWIFTVLWKYGLQNGVTWPSQTLSDRSIEFSLKSRKDYPPWVHDKHTASGKAQGSDIEQFFNEGIQVNQLQPLPLPQNFAEEHWQNYAQSYKQNNMEPIKLIRSNTYCASSDYFYVVSQNNPSDPKQIQIIEPGDEVIFGHFTLADLGTKTKISLKDLGVLQIPMVNTIGRRPYVVYCWLRAAQGALQRYVLKPYNSKQSAVAAAQSDIEMAKNIFQYSWCYDSKVICLGEEIKKTPTGFRVEDGRTYYTISPALPYFIPTTVALQAWKDNTQVAQQVILINLMKYIYGIPDRTARNTGVYFLDLPTGRAVRVCSFDHGPILSELKGPMFGKLGNIEAAALNSEREWLAKLKVDKKYQTRYAEVMTALSN